ncbi:hypothetical protein PanWU01x14_016590, partial [Parasponia andersonii]
YHPSIDILGPGGGDSMRGVDPPFPHDDVERGLTIDDDEIYAKAPLRSTDIQSHDAQGADLCVIEGEQRLTSRSERAPIQAHVLKSAKEQSVDATPTVNRTLAIIAESICSLITKGSL